MIIGKGVLLLMALFFVSEEHQQAFEGAIEKATAFVGGKGIQTPLYLLTSIPEVANNLEVVFNFTGGYINPDVIEEFNLSTGQRIIFALAVNLYNGYVIEDVELSPYQAMGWLSKEYRDVYLSAIGYRYC